MAWLSEVVTSFVIGYEKADGSEAGSLAVDASGYAHPARVARELGLTVRRIVGEGATAWRVSARPEAGLRVTDIEARIGGLGLRTADALFLNGYNSWTDSVERAPIAAMRGLEGIPRGVVERWGLDGSGDYRFVAQDIRPGFQHGFGYAYVRHDDEVLLVGSLDEDSGFTLIREAMTKDSLTLHKEPPAAALAVGELRELMSFAIVEGDLDAAVDGWLRRAGVFARPAVPVVGFSSWYRHYDDIDQFKMAGDLQAVSRLFEGRELGGCRKVFQIDDGYACVGDWTLPYARRFPDGMDSMARRISDAGFAPGLWMAPFVCSSDSQLFRDHPDWIMRDEAGKAVSTGSHWNGAFALDTLNPQVRAHVRASLRTATEDWGFRFLKLDFLYGACMVPHGGMNRGQLVADALDLVRETVGDEVVLDFCGVPLLSAFGRAEYCRIGCDVGLDWDDVPYMRLLHRERVSTKRSLANTRGRAHLDGRAFRNDPDVFFLRKDVKLTDAQRSDLIEADATLGGVFFTSDDVGSWDADQLAAFEAALATFVARSGCR